MDTLDFGRELLNNREEMLLRIKNNGASDLTISDITVAGTYLEFEFDGEIVIEPDNTYDTHVTFAPEEVGRRTGTLTIVSDDPDKAVLIICLMGIGYLNPVISVTPDTLSFNATLLDHRIERMLTISNRGEGVLYFTDVSMQGNYFSADLDYSWRINPDDNAEVTVIFDPERTGDFEGTLRIDSNDPENETVAIVLMGSCRENGVELVGTLDTPGFAYDVIQEGDFAYIADDDGYLRIINVSDLENPDEIAFFETEANARGIAVADGFAYVATLDAGLRIIDISEPDEIEEIGFYDTPGSAIKLALQDDMAYIADGNSGLRIIDVSNPDEPEEVGFVDTPGTAFDVNVINDIAYIADGTGGLRIIDISNVEHPYQVGYCDTPESVVGVSIQRDYAYVANADDGFCVFNISDSENPVRVFDQALDSPVLDVIASGEFAFITNDMDGFRLFNITDPENSILLDAGYRTEDAQGLFISGDYAYVADGENGLEILDISDFTDPVMVLSGKTLDFDEVEIGESGELTLTISNTGNYGLIVVDISITSDFYSVVFDDEFIIDPDDSVDMTVIFEPDEMIYYEDVLIITSNYPKHEEITIDLIGAGNYNPEIENPLPDIEIDEDHDQLEIADLDTVFADLHDNDITFSIEAAEELNLLIDEDNLLTMHPVPDFFCENLEVFVIANNTRRRDNTNRIIRRISTSTLQYYDTTTPQHYNTPPRPYHNRSISGYN
ncbi:MAG: choice-of-anchor D domain-containing protein [Candidatus Hatepunaea meridiana]|nr:choice-of-anchor D domain-containing protein [Candidatus Hatepunaea meridiana]